MSDKALITRKTESALPLDTANEDRSGASKTHGIPVMLAMKDSTFNLLAILTLLFVEYVSFAVFSKDIGIYTDEWLTFGRQHFCNSNFMELFKGTLDDPRLIVRPVIVPFFAIQFYFFQENPLGYHLLNAFFEFAAAAFSYLAIKQISKSRTLALLSALLFMVYPSHDVTHYGISSNSVNFATALFMLSVYLFNKSLDTGKRLSYIGSYTCFMLSILTYEICLPLIPVYTLFAAYSESKKSEESPNLVKIASSAILKTLPFIVLVVGMVLFRLLILPKFMNIPGQGYAMVFSPENFVKVMIQGYNASLGSYALTFCTKMAVQAYQTVLNPKLVAILVAGLVASGFALWKASKENIDTKVYSLAIVFGLIEIFFAYTVYGLSPDYYPVLDSSISRANAMSCWGAAIVLAGAIGLLVKTLPAYSEMVRRGRLVYASLALLTLMILCNWQFAQPWITSWTFQKYIAKQVKTRAASFKDGDVILIANSPRFVEWAPVFDGVWDFQSMLRTTLNNKTIDGDVICDRLIVSKEGIKDVSAGYTCADFPFHNPNKRIFVFVPNPEQWIEVADAPTFISVIREHGLSLGFLDPKVVDGWQKAIAENQTK